MRFGFDGQMKFMGQYGSTVLILRMNCQFLNFVDSDSQKLDRELGCRKRTIRLPENTVYRSHGIPQGIEVAQYSPVYGRMWQIVLYFILYTLIN
jgi:hypothetical protein